MTLEQHTTETSEMLHSANQRAYEEVSSDIFRIVALRTLEYLHEAMMGHRIKKLMKTAAETVLKDRQMASISLTLC